MTTRTLDAKTKPYFIWWDQKLTVEDVREAIASTDNLYRRITYMSYVLNDAEFEDIWRFVTLNDVQKEFWRIRWRTETVRETWRKLLTLLGYPPDDCADPRSARLLS
jgi:hypothetical protein